MGAAKSLYALIAYLRYERIKDANLVLDPVKTWLNLLKSFLEIPFQLSEIFVDFILNSRIFLANVRFKAFLVVFDKNALMLQAAVEKLSYFI